MKEKDLKISSRLVLLKYAKEKNDTGADPTRLLYVISNFAFLARASIMTYCLANL